MEELLVTISYDGLGEAVSTALDKLKRLEDLAFSEGDRRARILHERLSFELHAGPVTLWTLFDDGLAADDLPCTSRHECSIQVPGSGLSDLVAELNNRVCSYIDLAVPLPQQCEAFKGFAREAIWGMVRKLHSKSGARQEVDQPS